MYKILVVVCLSVCLFFVNSQLNREEGASCEWAGIKGKCVRPRVCLTSLDKRGLVPPVCSYKGEKRKSKKQKIICCTDCNLVNDTRNFIVSPQMNVFWKDGRKSRDACLQYLKDLPHICTYEGYYAGISRFVDTEHNCSSYHVWGVGGAPPPDAKPPIEYPYEALLGFGRYGEHSETNDWLTGGSIIHERFILTSAHVTTPLSNSSLLNHVALGVKNNEQESWQIHKVKAIYQHPHYNGHTRSNDIALLELETPITFNRDILPACLPQPNEEFDTSKAKFTMWTRNASDPNDSDITPRVSEAVISHRSSRPIQSEAWLYNMEAEMLTANHCNTKVGGIFSLYTPHNVKDDSQICYEADKDVPVIQSCIAVTTQYSRCMNTVIGVSSYRGHYNAETVFTNVKHFTPWIEEIVWH